VIGFDSYDIAENLQKGSIFEFLNKIERGESTLAFKSNSQFTTVPSDSSLGVLTINLVMAVPLQ
jgi:MFS-type transporter involved in bile tolerance (Atg22 family)